MGADSEVRDRRAVALHAPRCRRGDRGDPSLGLGSLRCSGAFGCSVQCPHLCWQSWREPWEACEEEMSNLVRCSGPACAAAGLLPTAGVQLHEGHKPGRQQLTRHPSNHGLHAYCLLWCWKAENVPDFQTISLNLCVCV